MVREIFNLRQQRMPVRAIARLLDEKGYLTPRQYAIKVGIRKKPMPENHWTSVAVYRILENPAYLGHMVVHKTEARLYQGIQKRKVDKKDQLFVPNVNEAIITQEQFDSVQGVKKVSKRSSKKQKAKNRESVQRLPVLRRMRKALICGEIQISQWERNAVLSLPYLSGPSREVLFP